MDKGPKIRVVLVDDDDTIIATVKLVLRKHPQIEIVGTGCNGREALVLANRLRPDVLVLDINMPVLNGLEATARISRSFPSIGVLMLTSEDTPDTIKQALRSGALNYLSKATELGKVGAAILDADHRRNRDAPCKGLSCTWAFYGAKGSAGATTLAINVALDLATLQHRVLLIDLDSLQGDCGFYLNLGAGKTSLPLPLLAKLEDLETIDGAELDSMVSRVPVDRDTEVFLDVLASPCAYVPTTERSQQHLPRVLDFLQARYDYVIIDLPSSRLIDPLSMVALDNCERLFLPT
ncbi:MAG: response regulator, partial [Candidatus Riflebacteria bacterium]|nr:response regulator [Candidatus Riflebacteria bacterium]